MDEYRTSRTRDNIAYIVFGTVLGAITATAISSSATTFTEVERIDVTTDVIGRGGPVARDTTATSEKVRQLGKSRVQLDLSPRAMSQLAELKEKTDAASYAEVFKNAMKLYDGIIAEIERGNTFLIRDKNGNVSEFRMFL